MIDRKHHKKVIILAILLLLILMFITPQLSEAAIQDLHASVFIFHISPGTGSILTELLLP